MTTQKLAIVTGSASGIGGEIARRMKEEGWRVIGIDLKASPHADVSIEADLTQWEALSARLDLAVGDSAIDAVVNCAGVQIQRGPSFELDIAALDRLYSHNLRPVFQMVNWALPRLTAQSCVINTGSISGASSVPGLAAYGAMKAALHSYSQSLARELGERGIRVNAIAPGYVDTPLTATMLQDAARVEELKQKIPLRWICQPSDIAETVLFLVSEKARYITGAIIPVDGGYLA